jgi:hypothetical protein
MCCSISSLYVFNKPFDDNSFWFVVFSIVYCTTFFSFSEYQIKKTKKTVKFKIKRKREGLKN